MTRHVWTNHIEYWNGSFSDAGRGNLVFPARNQERPGFSPDTTDPNIGFMLPVRVPGGDGEKLPEKFNTTKCPRKGLLTTSGIPVAQSKRKAVTFGDFGSEPQHEDANDETFR